MTVEAIETPALRSLAGATVLLAAPALDNDDIGRAVLDLSVALLRAGARALVSGGNGSLVGELQALGGEWTEAELSKTGVFKRRPAIERIGSLIRGENVDLVHAFGVVPARIAVAALKRMSVPLVTTYVGTPPPPSWRKPREDAQARGHRVLATSRYLAELIEARHKLAPERLAVVPPSIDTEWFDPAAVSRARVEQIAEEWRIRPEARMVLAPGRLIPSGGQLNLVDAARLLVNGGLRGVVFVLAGDRMGDPEYARAVDARIEAQGLSPLFRKVGHCADMPAAYALADLVVLPLERPVLFSDTLAEAQAMGCPVVATDLGALPDFLLAPPLGEDGPRSGWVTKSQDVDDLAHTLAQALTTDRQTLAEVSTQARRVSGAFSPEAVTAATLAVYESLLPAK